MAELKESIIEKLKCSECGAYLSCSPILLKTNGESVCGRCKVELDESELYPAVRNVVYEELASIVAFPCRYRAEGCAKRIPWNRVRNHEEQCDFRTYNCPALPFGSCPWTGINSKLLEHFKQEHAHLLLEHPCRLTPDLTQEHENNYLITVCGFLFLIQFKCCTSAGKVWCCVRYLGNSAYVSNFDYCLEIRNFSGIMMKTMQVSSRDPFCLHRHNTIEINTKTLMDFLGGYEHITFTITIQKKGAVCFKCKRALSLVKHHQC